MQQQQQQQQVRPRALDDSSLARTSRDYDTESDVSVSDVVFVDELEGGERRSRRYSADDSVRDGVFNELAARAQRQEQREGRQARGGGAAAAASAPSGKSAGHSSSMLSRMWKAVSSAFSFDIDFELADVEDADESDILGDLVHKRGSGKLLDEYTSEELHQLFRESGVFRVLHEHGYDEPTVKVDTSDPFVHQLTVSDRTLVHRPEGHNFLLDLFVRRRLQNVEQAKALSEPYPPCPNLQLTLGYGPAQEARELVVRELGHEPFKWSFVEFLRLQDPNAQFSGAAHAALPGQLHPGLGMMRLVSSLLVSTARSKGRDIFGNFPDHFHNALLYSRMGSKFLNPQFEGIFQSMVVACTPALKERGLGIVAWAVNEGKLVDTHTRSAVVWNAHEQEQVVGLNPKVAAFLSGEAYVKVVSQFLDASRFVLVLDQKLRVPTRMLRLASSPVLPDAIAAPTAAVEEQAEQDGDVVMNG